MARCVVAASSTSLSDLASKIIQQPDEVFKSTIAEAERVVREKHAIEEIAVVKKRARKAKLELAQDTAA
eukprot:3922341-Amphidinium_carterae.1